MSTPTGPAMRRLGGEYVVDAHDPDFTQKAVTQLETVGVAVLRGMVSDAEITALNARADFVLANPAICGTVGYYMKDPNKKLFDGLLLGKPAINALTSHKLIDVVEKYHGMDVVMTEVFLKHDLGNDRVYFPYHTHTGADRTRSGRGPFGCGAMLYLHDTDVGAFCYCPATHHWNSPHGSNPNAYPENMRKQIVEGMRRISGRRGDLVVFDSRGFHGPEQPVPTPRTVIITDYAPIAYCRDGTLKTGAPVVITDLTGLDQRQLRVLGIGMKAATPFEQYHIHSFNRTRGFSAFSRLLKWWFATVGALEPLRNVVRALRRRKLSADLGNDG